MVIILYVLRTVNVSRNKLNVNGSKCKCTLYNDTCLQSWDHWPRYNA